MSYNNFANSSPLVAVYNTTSDSSSQFTRKLRINTSLYQGIVSSNEVTFDYKSHLMSDFYGTTQVNMSANCRFIVDSVGQFTSLDINKGFPFSSRAPENAFGKANAQESVYLERKRTSLASRAVITSAGFPRITGVVS